MIDAGGRSESLYIHTGGSTISTRSTPMNRGLALSRRDTGL